jgi:hypothetical protein
MRLGSVGTEKANNNNRKRQRTENVGRDSYLTIFASLLVLLLFGRRQSQQLLGRLVGRPAIHE